MFRNRSESQYEEDNITSFVNSCVNFDIPHVAFHPFGAAVPAVDSKSQRNILLLFHGGNGAAALQRLPIASPLAEAAVQHKKGQFEVAEVSGSARIMLGSISTAASRHNSPARPDVARRLVSRALALVPGGGLLEVYYVGPVEHALPISVAVARATEPSFTAKNGAAESGYQAGDAAVPVHVFLDARDHAALRVNALATLLCCRLVDAPTSLLDTVTFAEIVQGWAARLQRESKGVITLDIVKGEALREGGYGGLYGTGKAAEYPPHLVTLGYGPAAGVSPRSAYAFVGKGIVYDTGGLAIKSRDGMCGMKDDMGGAAAVFAAVVALALLDEPVTATAVLCLADNAVGPRSQRNDDIVRLKSGKTVEINNTDAEGRLVLSDGVYHATAELASTPDVVVDMATLTGAQGVATGKLHAAVYARSEEIETALVREGRRSGDLVFPVLYCPELHSAEFASQVADQRNSVANRSNAQVSCAAYFIEASLAPTFKGHWAHVDIASPAVQDHRGTGFGVSLLTALAAGDRL